MYQRLPVEEKIRFIKRVLAGESVVRVCQEANISRTVFYRWLKKYQKSGPRAKRKNLTSKIRKGKRHWRTIPAKDERKIIKTCLKNPQLSPQKLNQLVSISPHGIWNVLKRKNLNTYKKRKLYLSQYGTSLIKPPDLTDKLAMIKRYQEGEKIASLCKEIGISRTTFYKWLKRYQTASLKEKKKILKSWRPKGENHWRFKPKTKELVLKIIIKFPQLSPQKISQKMPFMAGRPILGAHGVYNLLKKLNLNLYEKRLSYSQAHQPVTLVKKVADEVRPVLEKIPTVSPIPPPAPVFRPVFQRIKSLFLPFLLGLLSGITLFITLTESLRIISQAPNLGAKIGLTFAFTALGCGMFFLIYSMKYYFTLAIVLSFSRRSLVNGNGESENELKLEVDQQKGGFFKQLFGLKFSIYSNQSAKVDQEILGEDEVVHKPEGLLPSVDQITLKRYPFISIHLPLYNEKRVALRVLKACTKLKYPASPSASRGKPHFEIIVCDDSTDETTEMIERFAQKWNKQRTQNSESRTQGPLIKVLHRNTREGFKGGALRNALDHMDKRTEFISVFDADFVPYPDTLELFVKNFKAYNHNSEDYQRSKIAVVGGYQWHVLNKSENWITRGVRTEYSGSYVIERAGGEILGLLKQISGSVYMIRADLLKEIGWGKSITEDFQLTLKLYEKGYKVVYTPYIQAPAECVSTLKRLIRQRMRWAEGHSFNIKRMFKRMIASERVNLKEKLEFLYLSPYYFQAFLFLLGTLAWIISEGVFRVKLPFWTALWGWSLVFTNFLSLPLMNAIGLFLEEAEEKDYLGILSFIGLSYILAPFQAYASLRGFLKDEEGPWFRTPKTGRITDIFKRGKFYRWVSGIIPGWSGSRLATSLNQFLPQPALNYLTLRTGNNQFGNFMIKPKKKPWIKNLALFFTVGLSSLLSFFGNRIPQGIITNLPIQARVEAAGFQSGPLINQATLSQVVSLLKPRQALAATSGLKEMLFTGRQVSLEKITGLALLLTVSSLGFLIYLIKRKRKLVKKLLRPVFVFGLIASWLLASFPAIWIKPRFPPKIKETLAADYDETYSFDSLAANQDDFTWDGPDVDVLSTENTGGSWCWTNTGSTSSNTGPPSGVACVYTETSSPVSASDVFYMTLAEANEIDASSYGIYVTFNTCTYGNTSAHLYFEAWDGDSWEAIDDWAGNSTTTFTSRGPYDFTSYSNSDFSIRFRTVVGGTTYTNDMAVDEIRIYGDSANAPPAAPTLHNVPFANERVYDTTPAFEFTGSDPDGTADITYHIQIDDDQGFGSEIVECESDTSCADGAGGWNAGGDETDPFTEGVKMVFTPTTTLASGTTYWWRVRAEDVVAGGGSGNYGAWTTPISFTPDSGSSPYSEWFQTTDEQFETDIDRTNVSISGGSVQIASGGTISRLDAATSVAASTLNYSVSAGSNRVLIACFSWESNGQSQIDSATYGGQSMTQVFQQDTPDGGYSSGVACFYILDAGIGAASGTTITPTYSGTATDDEIIHAASYAGVDQTGGATTVPETHTAESNESTPNPFTTIDITEASGNLVIAIVSGGNNTTAAWQADMTEQNDQADSSSFSSFADRLSTTNANVTIEGTVASQNRVSAGSAEFVAASASSGSIQSNEIDFGWFSGSPSDWNDVYVGATTTNGSITIDILDENEADTGLGCVITSGGSSCTIDISSLDPAGDDTQIYILATLNDSGGTPYLNDWGVSVPEYSLIFLGLAPFLPAFVDKLRRGKPGLIRRRKRRL